MPEIAEVRVVANTLKKQLLNKKITDVKVLYPRIIDSDLKFFVDKIRGSIIEDIKTYGKWIIFILGEYSLLSHLRMEGKYFYVSKKEPIGKHNHVIFSLENDMELRYDDVRKFGRMELVLTNEIYQTDSIKKLGFEPDDMRLIPDYLLGKFKSKKVPIKTMLLDQTIINGLGNIYANEVLFASKINPLRESADITFRDANEIINNSEKIISESFLLGGTTIKSYTSSLGVTGSYQNELKVHGRSGLPCYVCGTPIKRIKIGGRSTYYCDSCQKK